MDPDFSVIVTTYRRPELLTHALSSIQQQTLGSFECLVVDDGSDTAADVMPDDPRFRLIALDQNGGVTRARNIGIGEARARAVTFLDDDDLWTPERLSLAAAGLEHASIAVCGTRWLDSEHVNRFPHLSGQVHDRIVDQFTPSLGRTAILRDEVLELDDRYDACEDVDWWIRQTEISTMSYDPTVGQLVRRHAGERHGNGDDARITGSELLLELHADYFASHPKARAFRQYRLGMLHLGTGNPSAGREWLTRSLRSRPSIRAARSLVRSASAR